MKMRRRLFFFSEWQLKDYRQTKEYLQTFTGGLLTVNQSFSRVIAFELFVCLFVLRLNVPVNNFSVMSGRSQRFLGLTSTVGS